MSILEGIEELMALMAGITDVILWHVADPKTRKAIADEIRCLTPRNPNPN